MNAVDVGALEAFPDPGTRVVTVDDVEIGIIRRNGEVYAIRNLCPHVAAPICAGVVREHIGGDIATSWTPMIDDERAIVVCPWHRWEFDAQSGRALVGRTRLRTYRTHIEGGRVLVDTSTRSEVVD